MLPVVESPRWTSLATVRKTYARIPEVHPIPNLIDLQLDSFTWFVEKGLRELFEEISPIQDFTGRVMELHFGEHDFGEPKYTELECRARDLTYARPLYVRRRAPHQGDRRDPEPASLHGRLPLHDRPGDVHHQRRRARRGQPAGPLAGRLLHRDGGPEHAGASSSRQGHPQPRRLARVRDQRPSDLQLWVKVDRKRKMPATKLLRAVGYEHERGSCSSLFAADRHRRRPRIGPRWTKDATTHARRGDHGVVQAAAPGRSAHRRQRARCSSKACFFNSRRYDLAASAATS